MQSTESYKDKNSHNRAEAAAENWLSERTKSMTKLSAIGIICFIITHGITGNLNRSRRNKVLIVLHSSMEVSVCIIFSSSAITRK